MKDKIITIPAGTSNVYLLKNAEHAILIDAGNKHKAQKIMLEMEKVGIKPTSLSAIIITHGHFDHCGSLAELKKRTKAQVIVHQEEAEALRNGFLELPHGTNFFSRFLVGLGKLFLKNLGHYTPVEPDIIIDQTFDMKKFGFDAILIPTPGHTPGSLTLIWKKNAFVGDSAFNIIGTGVYPPFANHPTNLLLSWNAILQSGVEYIYPGHGKPFHRSGLMRTYQKHT